MNNLEVIIPFIPMSWNTLKGRGWVKYKRFKDDIGMFLLPLKMKSRGMVFTTGVRITFVYGFTSDRRRDIDSLCTKPIIDSLVDMGILIDDNKNVVVETRNTWEYAPEERTRIIIESGYPVPIKSV